MYWVHSCFMQYTMYMYTCTCTCRSYCRFSPTLPPPPPPPPPPPSSNYLSSPPLSLSTDICVAKPDDKTVMTYVSFLYHAFPSMPPPHRTKVGTTRSRECSHTYLSFLVYHVADIFKAFCVRNYLFFLDP